MATRSPAPMVRRYYRSDDDRLIAGVAGGLAEHLGLSPFVIRVAFLLLAIAGGSGLLMYAAFWAFVPQRPGEPAQGRRSRSVPSPGSCSWASWRRGWPAGSGSASGQRRRGRCSWPLPAAG